MRIPRVARLLSRRAHASSGCNVWKRFIPVQAGGRMTVDTKGMNGRIDELLEHAMRRA